MVCYGPRNKQRNLEYELWLISYLGYSHSASEAMSRQAVGIWLSLIFPLCPRGMARRAAVFGYLCYSRCAREAWPGELRYLVISVIPAVPAMSVPASCGYLVISAIPAVPAMSVPASCGYLVISLIPAVLARLGPAICGQSVISVIPTVPASSGRRAVGNRLSCLFSLCLRGLAVSN